MPRVFAGIFTTDPALLDFSSNALRIYCGALFMFGIQIACQMTFISIGNAPYSILVAVIRKFILLLPLIYILPHLVTNSVNGVYMAEPIADLAAVSITIILFSAQFKKALRYIRKDSYTKV